MPGGIKPRLKEQQQRVKEPKNQRKKARQRANGGEKSPCDQKKQAVKRRKNQTGKNKKAGKQRWKEQKKTTVQNLMIHKKRNGQKSACKGAKKTSFPGGRINYRPKKNGLK